MKHAIMIMAHNNFRVLSTILKQFDSHEFDIYIHINNKVKFDPERIKNIVEKAQVTFVPRVNVGYCDYSMVRAIKSLLTTSVSTYHDYYHLISGADLLIKRRSQFLSFFEEMNGTEFVGVSKTYSEDSILYRNFFVAKCRQNSHFKSVFFIKLRKGLIQLQKLFHIYNKPVVEVKKGTDWFSVTHDAACYLVEQEAAFHKHFKYAYCPSEFFAPTILCNSHFVNHIYDLEDEGHSCIRTIDWNRGLPYVYTIEDKNFLINSSGMFGRKFDENKDFEIVNFFKDYVLE